MKSIIVGSIFTIVAYAARIAKKAPVIYDESSSFDPGALAKKYSETINNWQTIAMLEHKSEECEKGLEELGTQLVTEAVERATAIRAACQNWNSVECNKQQEALYEFEEKQKAKCKASGHTCHYTMKTSHGEEKIDTCMPKACHQDILAEHAMKPIFSEILCGESLTAPQPSLLQKMEQRISTKAPVIHDESSSFDPRALANKYSETINNWQTIAMLEHKSEECEKGLEELGTQLVTEAVEHASAIRAACHQNWNSVECNKKQEALYEFEEKQKAKCKVSGHMCHYTMKTSHGDEKIDTCMPKACHQDILAEHATKQIFAEIHCGKSLTAPQPSLLQKMEQEFSPVKKAAAPSMAGAKGMAKVGPPSRNQVALKAQMGTGVADVDNVGILDPVGFFDPLGLSENKEEGQIRRWREVELKHGRISMLAALGFLNGEKFHPLFGGDIDGPSALAFEQAKLKPFWPVIVAAIAALELGTGSDLQNPDRRPGDFGWDPLKKRPEDPNELDELQTKEIQNGRLAMLGIAGMVAQEMVNGKTIFFGGNWPEDYFGGDGAIISKEVTGRFL